MSDQPVRRASFFSVLAVFIGLGLFGLVLRYFYTRPASLAPYNVAAEKLPEDQAWKATPEGRREHLQKLQAEQTNAATTADWVDRSKGVVRLPIARAMELTVQQNQAQKKQ